MFKKEDEILDLADVAYVIDTPSSTDVKASESVIEKVATAFREEHNDEQ